MCKRVLVNTFLGKFYPTQLLDASGFRKNKECHLGRLVQQKEDRPEELEHLLYEAEGLQHYSPLTGGAAILRIAGLAAAGLHSRIA
jgi:hypothetical protein